MTFDDLWDALVTKHEKLANPEATVVFKPENLKKLLRQVYGQGFKHHKDLEKTIKDLIRKGGPSDRQMANLRDILGDSFGGLFG